MDLNIVRKPQGIAFPVLCKTLPQFAYILDPSLSGPFPCWSNSCGVNLLSTLPSPIHFVVHEVPGLEQGLKSLKHDKLHVMRFSFGSVRRDREVSMRKDFSTSIGLALCLILSGLPALAQDERPQAEVNEAVKHDVSPPLRDIRPPLPPLGPPREIPWRRTRPLAVTPSQLDPVVQTLAGASVATTAGIDFDGIDDASQAVQSGVLVAPPDTNGAVGATQFVQWVNLAFAVFDKTTGALVFGPKAGNFLWTGFGDPCETNNDGDPIAQYDKAANRWVPSTLPPTRILHLDAVWDGEHTKISFR